MGKRTRSDMTYLVTKNWVELIEDIFRETSSLYGDSASTHSDIGGGNLGHHWGGHAPTWGTSSGG